MGKKRNEYESLSVVLKFERKYFQRIYLYEHAKTTHRRKPTNERSTLACRSCLKIHLKFGRNVSWILYRFLERCFAILGVHWRL